MKASWFLGLCSLAALATAFGCRGVIGIEDVVIDGGSGQGSSSSQDGSTTGAEGGPGSHDSGTSDAEATIPDLSACTKSLGAGPCGRCCKDNSNGGIGALDSYLKASGCICQDAQGCTTECAGSGFCEGTNTTPPPATCATCFDSHYRAGGGCDSARATCQKNALCKNVLDCLDGCQ